MSALSVLLFLVVLRAFSYFRKCLVVRDDFIPPTMMLVLLCVASDASDAAEPIRFNPAFFGNGRGETLDLSSYERGNPLTPGTYRLDLYLNQNRIGTQEILLRRSVDGSKVEPCLPPALLEQLGVDFTRLPEDQATLARAAECLGPDEMVPQGHLEVDMADLRADLSIPQLYLTRTKRGYVSPKEWDAGVNAGFLGYNHNLSENRSSGQSSRQFYSGLNTGLNLGQWRLRHNGSYRYDGQSSSGRSSQYNALSSYVQRDITAAQAQLTLGEFYTPGNLFDSFSFTGIQLRSDERMLPDSMRGFAPVIRGVADTTAKVSVRQRQNLLYETTVPPGPFAIDDLNSAGYAGDLNVTITEADGRTKSFVVPYASMAQLLRPGSSRFSLSAGRLRDDSLDSLPGFVQGTYQYGLSNLWTGYGGSILARDYRALQGGVALSTSLGAVAMDLTHSQASGLNGDQADSSAQLSGRSLRLSYNKQIASTATNFSVAAYRFSSEGYLNFDEFARLQDNPSQNLSLKQRSRLQLSLSQPIGERLGQLSFSGLAQNYWSRDQGRDLSYQVGYSNNFDWGGFSFSATRTRSGSGSMDNQYLLSISLPLGRSRYSPFLNSSISYDGSGNHGVNTSLSGGLGESGQVGYSLYGSRDLYEGQSNSNYGGNLRYDASHANYSLSASRGENYQQANLAMQGTLVAHPGGINATSSQGETIAVLEASGAKGAQVLSNASTRIADNGYAVVTGLTPYRRNDMALDPKGTSRDVELEMTSQQVAPRAGAVVMLRYPTVTGRAMLLKLVRDDGEMIPLGAQVFGPTGEVLTQVGQGGRAFVRGLEGQGQLLIQWGEGQNCLASYRMPSDPAPNDEYYQQLELPCHTGSRILNR
ncbi:fimbrial biogenesis outer membrane usher protein [Pseudomonas sp. TKO26]|uniref:fimbria/pilus outer membrane usher protein n=1 Tax=unclassified Pseudomonas TaxID=196821 RepID=UPI000D985F3C|nr:MULTISPECIES: fimbria/pilus outer membrane usher protein [unclassified Pseudomonas]PYY79668.1 fimbrial biogenesis outer membrane usher protein [Pseudomonas sp. TKO30]PYY80824.1 fimbrial biogenesis outer membrane usher protein [Pseudomonas sp. TKO29]PYY82631.1 fimbrial biogenesis outer membrane usher protein [Pseudomonas sp. TKO26]PYY97166.1 fimbrial biogenesis outer membrane usher protein [Pseudomonas sp. TKO14]